MIKKGDIIEGKVERVDFPNKGVLTVDEEQLTVKNVIPGQYKFYTGHLEKGKMMCVRILPSAAAVFTKAFLIKNS